jgi:LacI family gluconate utilization system Gnt-I transcriptional repressor
VGALLECRRLGLSVPGRLAIAGLGDLEIAGELTPGLTTVRVPSYAIGRRAGELLLKRIAGETPAERVVDLGFEIVARESA